MRESKQFQLHQHCEFREGLLRSILKQQVSDRTVLCSSSSVLVFTMSVQREGARGSERENEVQRAKKEMERKSE